MEALKTARSDLQKERRVIFTGLASPTGKHTGRFTTYSRIVGCDVDSMHAFLYMKYAALRKKERLRFPRLWQQLLYSTVCLCFPIQAVHLPWSSSTPARWTSTEDDFVVAMAWILQPFYGDPSPQLAFNECTKQPPCIPRLTVRCKSFIFKRTWSGAPWSGGAGNDGHGAFLAMVT